jgi:hypothetical protein
MRLPLELPENTRPRARSIESTFPVSHAENLNPRGGYLFARVQRELDRMAVDSAALKLFDGLIGFRLRRIHCDN